MHFLACTVLMSDLFVQLIDVKKGGSTIEQEIEYVNGSDSCDKKCGTNMEDNGRFTAKKHCEIAQCAIRGNNRPK